MIPKPMRIAVVAALLLLWATASVVAQSPDDVCQQFPQSPQCPQPTQPPPVVVTPDGQKFPIPLWVAWFLGGIGGFFVVLKTFGILDRALLWWDESRKDVQRFGHPHRKHHPKDHDEKDER